MTPLIRAATGGKEYQPNVNAPALAVSYLLDRVEGRPLIDYETRGGGTALLCAARYGRLANVEVLLDRGALVDRSSNANGDTALHVAAQEGKVRVVKLLVERGADTFHQKL